MDFTWYLIGFININNRIVCYQLTHCSSDYQGNIYNISCCYHQSGSINSYPLLTCKSWNNYAFVLSFHFVVHIFFRWHMSCFCHHFARKNKTDFHFMCKNVLSVHSWIQYIFVCTDRKNINSYTSSTTPEVLFLTALCTTTLSRIFKDIRRRWRN